MRLLSALFALPAWLAGAAAAAPVEWNFDRAGDLQGWQPNGHLTGVAVSNGVLSCRAVGSDPILELRAPLDIPATPWQQLVVRLKADRDGVAEFFWSNTTTGRFGGFDQEKTTRFAVTGDGRWHTCRPMPFWQSEGKIVRLRFDLYDGAAFEVDSIRIAELAPPSPAAAAADFDPARRDQGWQATGDLQLAADAAGLSIAATGREGVVFAPPVRLAANEQNCISLRLAVDRGTHGTVFFATEQAHGLHSFSFPLGTDGRERTYNLDPTVAPEWKGTIVALGFRPSDAAGAQARLRWFRVGAEPQGPPQLTVESFVLADALPRTGVPAHLTALVSNTGGETASNLQARLSLPEDVRVLGMSPAEGRVARLGFGEEAELNWTLQCDQPLAAEAAIELAGPNAGKVAARAPLQFCPPLEVAKTGYVPEPKPVRGTVEVGAYYFPGWNTAERWQPLRRFPERRPVLGWYREGDPEVADWHIKWAVEHGITFFAYDWYWSQGARHLEHALHDGFFKSRYHDRLKFCLLWANHNPPHTLSLEDCRAVARYWIEHYFRRPEHLQIDGRPAVIIFSVQRFTDDLGAAGVKAALEAMREECRAAGLKGLHVIACVGSAGEARVVAAEGYDAVTCYNWPGLGMQAGEGLRAPFETLPAGYRRQWEHIFEQSPIPLDPLPVCGGWDSRPWHGDQNLVRFGRTPELFKRHLQDAKAFLSAHAKPGGAPGAVLVEAWNEWGEGSYIEPHQEFGFGYLDAIREVFTSAPAAHDDVTPADAGLGPYDVPPALPPATAWDFSGGVLGWSRTMELADVAARDGALAGRTSGRDPAFFSPGLKARAGAFTAVEVRMKLQRAGDAAFRDQAQLFWRSGQAAENEAASAHFEVNGDGQWHDYRIPVGANPRWRGLITELRLDPCNQSGVEVALASLRLE